MLRIAPAPAGVPHVGARRPAQTRRGAGRPLHTGAPAPSLAIVHVAAECTPFARTGGLGEAVRTLAQAQIAAGDRASVVIPLYGRTLAAAPTLETVIDALDVRFGARTERVRVLAAPLTRGTPRTFFVDHPVFRDRAGLYGEGDVEYGDNAYRFGLLSAAAVAALPLIAPDVDVLHAHDWHAALAPVYLRLGSRLSSDVATVLSVHNAAFQGRFGREVMPLLGLPWELFDWRCFEHYGAANLLKGGLAFADVTTTVSPRHAAELRTPLGGFGMHDAFASLGRRLFGVLNGIDQRVWDPASDLTIAERFSAADLTGKRACKAALQRAFGLAEDASVPLFAFCARLTAQKGLDVLLSSGVLHRAGAQFVLVGEGESRYARALHDVAARYPDRVAVRTTFSESAEHLLMAGADACLMPSVFEPCGLTQMRAQRYGAVPVAHEVGGLADTITDGATGILFAPHTAEGLVGAIERAIGWYRDRPSWEALMRRAMARDSGWERSAVAYRDAYRRALKTR